MSQRPKDDWQMCAADRHRFVCVRWDCAAGQGLLAIFQLGLFLGISGGYEQGLEHFRREAVERLSE